MSTVDTKSRRPAMTVNTLDTIYLLASVRRREVGEEIMFIGKCSENGPLGFGERGARRRPGGRGISESVFVTVHPRLIQQEDERVTECAKEADIPKDERLTPNF
ncbi:hypothetical protein PAMP_003049 [Pampus punctatissimus]